MKKSTRHLLLVLLFALPFSAQSQFRSPVDSIDFLIKKLTRNDILDSVSLEEIKLQIVRNSLDSLQTTSIHDLLLHAPQLQGRDVQLFLRYLLNFAGYFNGLTDMSIDRQKILIAELLDYKTEYQKYILTKAMADLRLPYRSSNRIREGIEYYLELVKMFEKKNDADLISTCYYVLRGFYYTIGLIDKAIYFQHKSIQYLEPDKVYLDTFLLVSSLRNLGVIGYVNRTSVLASIYTEMGEPAKSLPLLYQARSAFEKYKDSIYMSDRTFIYLEILRAKILLKEDSIDYYLNYCDTSSYNDYTFRIAFLQVKGQHFLLQNDLDSARIYLHDALELRKKRGDEINATIGLLNPGYYLAMVYQQLGNYGPAQKVLKQEIDLLRLYNLRQPLLNALKLLASIYKDAGDFRNATLTLEDLTAVREEVIREEVANRTMTYEVEQNIAAKEKAMETLTIENEFQRKSKYYTFGIAGLIFILALGLLLGYRNKQKTNRDLAEKNTIISLEKEKSEKLLLNILPFEVAEELKTKGHAEAQLMDEVTVLFTDFKGFTQLSEKLTPKELVAEINECFSAFDHIMQKHGVEKIKTIGDAYMAAGGLPTANHTHANDVVHAALDIQKFMLTHKKQKETAGELYFEIRIGIHTGPVVAGIVGVKKFAYDIWGDTVNTASRMESSGEVGQVNISQTTYELVKEEFACTHRGKIAAKGKGEVDMYFVAGLGGDLCESV